MLHSWDPDLLLPYSFDPKMLILKKILIEFK